MYFGCMKNWWLCSSLFWFQDETLQISIHHSNVIGQGDISYVFDKWSLNSLKYKIFFVDVNLQLKFSKYCMFTTKFWEVLYHLKLDFQHQICMGFFLLTKRNKRFSLRNILVLSQAYQHLEALNWRGLHLVSTEACVQCSTNISISPLHIILHIEDLSSVLHSTSCWISA